MTENESLGSFFESNKSLAKQYLETRLEILTLSAVRMVSKSAGYFAWLIISSLLIFLVVLFGGVTLGFWLSNLTGSLVTGFGLVAAILALKLIILAAFRKKLFLEPLIHFILHKASEGLDSEE